MIGRTGGLRARALLVGAATAAAGVSAGCAAGQVAQTAEVVPGVPGAQTTLGAIQVHNATVEYPSGGAYQAGESARLHFVIVNTGQRADQLVHVSSGASTGARIVPATEPNEAGPAADRSTGRPSTSSPTASSPTASSPTASGPAGSGAAGSTTPSSAAASGSASSAIPSAHAPIGHVGPRTLSIGPQSNLNVYGDGASVTLTGLVRPLRSSQRTTVTFTFAHAGQLQVSVPVAPANQLLPKSAVPSAE